MISQDEGLTVGLRKYRELFPLGTLPTALEDAAILTHYPGMAESVVLVTFGLRGQTLPYVLFKASVSRETGKVTVETLGDWHEVQVAQLDDAKSL